MENKLKVYLLGFFALIAINTNILTFMTENKKEEKPAEKIHKITVKQKKAFERKFKAALQELYELNIEVSKQEKLAQDNKKVCKQEKLIQDAYEKVIALKEQKTKESLLEARKLLKLIALQEVDLELKLKACSELTQTYFIKNNYKDSLCYSDEIIKYTNQFPELIRSSKKYCIKSMLAESCFIKGKIYKKLADKEKNNIERKKLYLTIAAKNSQVASKIFTEYLNELINNKRIETKEMPTLEERMLESNLDAGQYAIYLLSIDETMSTQDTEKYTNSSSNSLKKIIDFVEEKIKRKDAVAPYMIEYKSYALNDLANLLRSKSYKRFNVKDVISLYTQAISIIKDNNQILSVKYSQEAIDNLCKTPAKNIANVIKLCNEENQ